MESKPIYATTERRLRHSEWCSAVPKHPQSGTSCVELPATGTISRPWQIYPGPIPGLWSTAAAATTAAACHAASVPTAALWQNACTHERCRYESAEKPFSTDVCASTGVAVLRLRQPKLFATSSYPVAHVSKQAIRYTWPARWPRRKHGTLPFKWRASRSDAKPCTRTKPSLAAPNESNESHE